MKTTLAILTLALLSYVAWHPVKQLKHTQTRLERQQSVMEVYERCRPDFTLKQVEALPMPLHYSGDEERDN